MKGLLWMSLLVGLHVWAGPTEEILKTYPMEDGKQLTVRNINGKIEVNTWDKQEVELRAIKRYDSWLWGSKKDRLKNVKIEVRQENGNIHIETQLPKKSSWWGSYSVSYELHIPRRTTVGLKTTNGKIQVTDVKGKVDAVTTNGQIYLNDVHGAVDARTTNGKIIASVLDPMAEEIRLRTTNGGIRLDIPEDMKADLRARCTNGRVNVNLEGDLNGDFDRKRVRAKLNGGGTEVSLNTTNGSINIGKAG